MGNIIGSILSADVFSRYSRTRNQRTLYVCGTDEYGTATETQALKEGITPKELCDKYHLLHRNTYEWFEIGFDYFGRTSTPHHTEISQSIYSNLGKNGFLERQEKEQTYCETCPKFLADRFVEGTCPHCGYDDARGDQCDGCSRTLDAIELIQPRCLLSRDHKVTTKISSHMYFSMQSIQPKTEDWIKVSAKKGKWSSNSVINNEGQIIDARLKGGLKPTPLTRDLKWGVPVPIDSEEDPMKGKVLYVWFDAPIGYPSITANYTPEWKKWWFDQNNVELYQFMGKDNVYFHTVYFPSVLLAEGRDWTTLHHLSTTEFLNYEGGKFSKSRNRGVFGPQARETGIPASVWRYYLISTRPETQDAMFSWADCIAANNNVLLNNFGNFINRNLKFISSQYSGVLPESSDAPGPYNLDTSDPDHDFLTEINSLLDAYITAMDAVKLRLGLQIVMQTSARGNLYLQASGLNKALLESNPARCAQVVSRALNLIWVLSAMTEPFMPGTSAEILEQINAPMRVVQRTFSNDILSGHVIGKPAHLFKKIEDNMEGVWKKQFAGTVEAAPATDAAPGTPDPLKAQPGVSKRKQAAAAKAKTAEKANIPRSDAYKAHEAKVAEQGQVVRALKGKEKSAEADAEIALAIEKLKSMKLELETL